MPAPLPCNRMPCSPLKCIGGGRKGKASDAEFLPFSPGGLSSKEGGEKRKSAANLATRPSPPLPLPLSLSFSTCNFFLPPTPTSSSATPTTSILLPERRRKERKKGKFFSPFSRRRRHTKSTSSKNPLSLSALPGLGLVEQEDEEGNLLKKKLSSSFPPPFLSPFVSPPFFPTLPRNEEAERKEEVKALSLPLQTVNSPSNRRKKEWGWGHILCACV